MWLLTNLALRANCVCVNFFAWPARSEWLNSWDWDYRRKFSLKHRGNKHVYIYIYISHCWVHPRIQDFIDKAILILRRAGTQIASGTSSELCDRSRGVLDTHPMAANDRRFVTCVFRCSKVGLVLRICWRLENPARPSSKITVAAVAVSCVTCPVWPSMFPTIHGYRFRNFDPCPMPNRRFHHWFPLKRTSPYGRVAQLQRAGSGVVRWSFWVPKIESTVSGVITLNVQSTQNLQVFGSRVCFEAISSWGKWLGVERSGNNPFASIIFVGMFALGGPQLFAQKMVWLMNGLF